jgi:hypothetical protein
MNKPFICLILLFSFQAMAGLEFTFSKDNRPSDGSLKELSIVANDGHNLNSSSVSLKEVYYSRRNAQVITNILFDNRSLSCLKTFTTRSRDTIKRIVCSRDDRPVDGALRKLTVLLNNSGTYNVSLFTSYFSRTGQGNIESTKDLAYNLIYRKK